MCVAWIDVTTKAIRLPDERNLGWPKCSIPPPSRPWKRRSRSCSASSTTPTPSSTRGGKATRRSRSSPTPSPDVGALPTVAGHRERTLLPARHPAFLRPPLPGCGEDAPLLAAPPGEEAPALPGAPAALGPARIGGRARDAHRRFDVAF